MTRTLKAVMAIVIVFTLVIAGTFFFGMRPVESGSTETIRVGIPQNSTTADIGNLLYEKGLIRNRTAFKILTRTKGVAADLGTGTYDLTKSMNMNEIINKIASGEQTGDLKFTVPEGSEVVQIAEILKGLGLKDSKKFLELTNNPSIYSSDYPFLNDVPKGASLEGYLYPATYYLTDEDLANPDAIIRMMLDNFSSHFTDEIIQAGKSRGLGINQIVTLASLVEREAQVDSDRPLVSAVFQNRIKKDMYLESCASVQYIIGERKPVLSLEDTDIDSPYNTYRNGGLPPTPIASPGVKSLDAAVHPADVDYLFFIARGDGTHIFSSTFDEHLKAQKEIQNAN